MDPRNIRQPVRTSPTSLEVDAAVNKGNLAVLSDAAHSECNIILTIKDSAHLLKYSTFILRYLMEFCFSLSLALVIPLSRESEDLMVGL